MLRTTKQYKTCQLILLPKIYAHRRYSIGLQKDSPFLKLFNYHLQNMAERGVLDQITKKYDTLPQECPDYTGKALGFHTLVSGFVLVSCGIIVSFVIWVMEYMVSKFNKTISTTTLDENQEQQQEESSEEPKDEPIRAARQIILQDVEVHTDSITELNRF